MLGSTKELLNNARIYFDELGYHFHISEEEIDYLKFLNCFYNTIYHTETFKDAIEAIKMFRYLDKKFEKIIDAIYKYPEYFDSLEYGQNEILSLVSDEEAIGIHNLSNAVFEEWSDIILFGQTVDDSFSLMYEDSRFFVYKDDSKLFLRYSRLSKEKMVLVDNNDDKLAIIKLNNNLDIEISNNYTNYEVFNKDGITFLYRKGEKEKSEDNYDAILSWDILDKNSKVGLARFIIYEEEADEELIILLAASCLLLYKGVYEASRSINAGLLVALSASHICRH